MPVVARFCEGASATPALLNGLGSQPSSSGRSLHVGIPEPAKRAGLT